MSAEAGFHIQEYLNAFHIGYLECLRWAGYDNNDGDPKLLEDVCTMGLTVYESFSREALESTLKDCTAFVVENWLLLAELHMQGKLAPDYAGHDFYLTRNGHGAGFWDRGMGVAGEKLTAACHAYGETSEWVNADDLIEVE